MRPLLMLMAIVVFVAAYAGAAAQTAPAAPVLDGHTGGLTHAVTVADRYAYAGSGAALAVLDIADPTAPTLVGKTAPLTSVVRDVEVVGGRAYVAAGGVNGPGGLHVVDVAEPGRPVALGYYALPGEAVAVSVVANRAYLAHRSEGLRIIDVTDPAQPRELGAYRVSAGNISDVAVVGQHAYVAAEIGGLHVLDVADPANPRAIAVVGTDPEPRWYPNSLSVIGPHAYVAGAGLRVVDVSDPAAPRQVGLLEANPGFVSPGFRGVALVGSRAYLTRSIPPSADSAREGELWVVDVSDPARPRAVAAAPVPTDAQGLTISGTHALVGALGAGLRVFRLADQAAPAEVGAYDPVGDAQSVLLADGRVYVLDRRRIRIFAAGSGGDPRPLGVLPIDLKTAEWAGEELRRVVPSRLAVSAGRLYLAGGSLGLRVFDVSDAARPFELPAGGPAFAHGVAVAGNLAYVAGRTTATGGGSLFVVDVGASPPRTVGSVDGFGYSVALAGRYVYTNVGCGDLRVVDVADPGSPRLVGELPGVGCGMPGVHMDVVVDGDRAYTNRLYGVRIVDVSDPARPTLLGDYSTGGWAAGLAASGDRLYVAWTVNTGGLDVVDVSSPAAPRLVGQYPNDPSVVTDVALGCDRLFVAAGGNGLLALRDVPVGAATAATPLPTASAYRAFLPSVSRHC